MARKYSYMYSRLIKSDRDVVGSIAYSLYKNAKIAYIQKMEQENGCPITELKLQEYDKSQQTSEQIQLYLSRAEDLLAEMNQTMLNTVVSSIERESRQVRTFWYGVWQSVLGGWIYSLVLIFVSVVISVFKPEIWKIIISLFG